ncbi:hypothetical protein [Mycoplasma leonicaptivi]|uniref:hypothetical protein n=1 Tax=Mycoplasma leonicaptivi TaxID=36742 RepID=UPI000483911E|nr:hypothetical protein [Mycoplasma leonicaptivi]
MKNTKFNQKLSFRTKLRYLFLGKYPIERRYKPKILEYLFLTFANIINFVMLLIISLGVNNLINEGYTVNVAIVKLLQGYEYRIIVSVIGICYLSILFFSLHIFYILNKTEFNKWIGIVGVLLSLGFFSAPLAIIFLSTAYQKNELAFE